MSTPDPTHTWLRELDAGYLFGALDEHDELLFRAHLAACERCRADVDDLRGTLDALQLLHYPADAPPSDLLRRILAAAHRERQRRRVLTGVLVAAALVGAVVLGTRLPRTHHDEPAEVAMTAVRSSPVTATAALEPTAWGTRVVLHCRYHPSGYAGTAVYRLRAITRDGRRLDLGSWSLAAGGETTYTSGVAVRPDQLRSVEVTSASGTALLRLPG